ncbi:MAG: transcriptional regulator [Symbiobacteriaceae bacterium]|jgi:transcriptional regulator with XRE-family HTH domain|nr:transcriptional regulator [Symbiobacteriaceae bacterium]
MGERLAWARNQQELILQQVSERSGLAIGYISQLEKGAKVNPTIDALARLAKALGVTVGFILGEVQASAHDDVSAMLMNSHAWTIGQRFARYIEVLSKAEKDRMLLDTVEQRFGRVVDFLCEHFPTIFTRTVLAFQLGLSVRGLNDILERDCEVGAHVLQQVVSITGIPMHFFATGQLEAPAEMGRVSPAQVIQYMLPISMAAEMSLTPEQLATMIREFATSRK